MKFLNRLERKWGRHAIPNLMYYMIALYAMGLFLDLFAPGLYTNWLSLDVYRILHGEIWRLVTFVLQPPSSNIFFVFIELYMYYSIGRSLEAMWGTFRFNVYYFSGLLFQIVAAFLFYGIACLVMGQGMVYVSTVGIGSMYYVNRSMFLAYIVMVPNATFYLSFLIPVKAKWLGIFYGILMGYEVFSYLRFYGLRDGGPYALAIVVSVLNFLIFFLMTRNYQRMSPSEIKRKAVFRKKMNDAKRDSGNVVEFRGRNVITRHKCAVCGRTELDDDSLEFRFCSKCDGNYEYCSEHLYTHTHVKKTNENTEE
ncbi:MAG: hypothetical protein PUC30_05910 [Lachnospiraceae bacterium]|nr:hypothetical protein [Lachnospiraceae bacterium]